MRRSSRTRRRALPPALTWAWVCRALRHAMRQSGRRLGAAVLTACAVSLPLQALSQAVAQTRAPAHFHAVGDPQEARFEAGSTLHAAGPHHRADALASDHDGAPLHGHAHAHPGADTHAHTEAHPHPRDAPSDRFGGGASSFDRLAVALAAMSAPSDAAEPPAHPAHVPLASLAPHATHATYAAGAAHAHDLAAEGVVYLSSDAGSTSPSGSAGKPPPCDAVLALAAPDLLSADVPPWAFASEAGSALRSRAAAPPRRPPR